MRPTTRWLVPVAVAATIVGGTAVSSALASTTPELAERTPAQLLASIAGSRVTALSGTVSTHADLGLPSLPTIGGGDRASTSSPQALLTRFLAGDNTIRVWLDGPQRERAQLVDPFAELDVVHNGSQLWTYDSHSGTVQHATLSARPAAAAKTGPTAPTPTKPGSAMTWPGWTGADLSSLTPGQLADQVLAAADPTTTLAVGKPVTVAGHDAYTLLVTPKTAATLVDHVAIAVDAGTGLPLRVSVYARHHTAVALESGFTKLELSRPSGSVFDFSPPRSATVHQLTLPSAGLPGATTKPGTGGSGTGTASGTSGDRSGVRPTVLGTGWASIVELPAGSFAAAPVTTPGPSGPSGSSGPSNPSGSSAQEQAGALIGQLTTPVAGGRALRTALLTVLLTQDGRVLAGSVPLEALQAAAAH
jgi:outer membrane lipoprotein-sorting protein